MTASNEEDGKSSLVVQLQADAELLVKVPSSEPRCHATIKVMTAAADPRVDVFGAPLLPDVQYYLMPGSSFSVFAWTNAVIRIEGSQLLCKNIMRSSMRSLTRPIVEYHCQLHQVRSEAERSMSLGPITVVCGMNTGGKQAVARSLCSYAARTGWKPLFVDLDCGASQSIGIPGTIGAAVVEFPISMDENIALTCVSTTLFTGILDPQYTNTQGEATVASQYSHFSSMMMKLCSERLNKHRGSINGSSGAVILLPELRDNAGVNFVADLTQTHGVSNVICVGDDYMFHKLYSRFSTQTDGRSRVHVDRISQSYLFGVPPNPEQLLPRLFSNYFHGSGAIILHPSQWAKPYTSLDILCLKEENDQAVLATVERDALQGIIGCIGALFQSNKINNALHSSPFAYARIQSVDATGVSFLTTTHFTFPAERLAIVVGSVRWITSTDLH